MESRYPGVDILEALESARNYNDYLVGLVRQATDSNDLIDFGAGIGTFSKLLRAASYGITCVEPDPLLRNRLIEEGFTVSKDLSPVPDESVPFIFSLNVLEHINDDEAAIRQIARKLKPGGKLLIFSGKV